MKPQRAKRLERLVDAHPKLEHGGTWLSFDCPIHLNDATEEMSPEERVHHWCRVAIPLRGGHEKPWDHTGDSFETITVSPSIARRGGAGGCEWHGFIRNGRFEHCGDSR